MQRVHKPSTRRVYLSSFYLVPASPLPSVVTTPEYLGFRGGGTLGESIMTPPVETGVEHWEVSDTMVSRVECLLCTYLSTTLKDGDIKKLENGEWGREKRKEGKDFKKKFFTSVFSFNF